MDETSGIPIKRLTPADAVAYTRLRAHMVVDEPFAFLGAPGDDESCDPAVVEARLRHTENAIVAALDPEDPERLVGSAGVYREPRAKTRHLATIWGVFVARAFRRCGLGERLVARAIGIAEAWEGVSIVQLSVSARLPAARRVYEKLGFVAWGEEPGAMVVGGELVAEIHMQRTLERAHE